MSRDVMRRVKNGPPAQAERCPNAPVVAARPVRRRRLSAKPPIFVAATCSHFHLNSQPAAADDFGCSSAGFNVTKTVLVSLERAQKVA